MKKALLILSSLGVLTTLIFVLISCGGSDPKPSKAKVSFASSSKTVQESAGTVEVKVLLDKAVTTDLVVSYSLSGTATQKAGIVTGDYSITGDAGEVTIPKGETSASIEISIVNDDIFEQDETIDLTLSDVTGNEAQISDTNNEIDITIQSDDPGSVVSFATASPMTTTEGETVEIQVQLDIPSPQDITISYSLSGTAVDSVKADSNSSLFADYAIEGGTPGELTIPAGETTGTITIDMYWDFALEDNNLATQALDPETIKITLSSATNGGTINSNKDEMNINLQQEDGLIVELDWDYSTVDLDLGIWWGSPSPELIGVINASQPTDDFYFEQIFLPKVWVDGLKFGLSYIYKSGSQNPMNFQVNFIDVIDGAVEPSANWSTYDGSYGLNNLNNWQTEEDITQTEQTFEFSSNDFTNFSALTVPASGSRIGRYLKSPSIRMQKQTLKINRQFLR